LLNERLAIAHSIGLVLRQWNLGRFCRTALPENLQPHHVCFQLLGHGYVFDQLTEHALAVTRRGGGSRPQSREVARQLLFRDDGAQRLTLETGKFGLEIKRAIVPALLERSCIN
jgi:hypothetical protein